MNRKKKIPKALFGLIIIIIIIIWFLNLKSIWPQIGRKDELIPNIKNIILDIDQSFQNLKKDLESKKELFASRLKILEEQEEKFKTEAKKLQDELMKEMKKD